MRIEHCAQVLSPTIGSQDLDPFTVILGECPCLKGLVGPKSLVLGAQQEAHCVVSGVIGESDEVVVALAGRGAGWSPNIGMYFITKVFCQGSDPDRWDRQAGCTCKQAHVAMGLLRLKVNFDPLDGSALDKLAGTAGGDVPYAVVQFHDT